MVSHVIWCLEIHHVNVEHSKVKSVKKLWSKPDVTHETPSPRPSPPFLHTVSDQKLEAGTAWE